MCLTASGMATPTLTVMEANGRDRLGIRWWWRDAPVLQGDEQALDSLWDALRRLSPNLLPVQGSRGSEG